MIDFNKNYLNHNFTNYNKCKFINLNTTCEIISNMFKCLNCNLIISSHYYNYVPPRRKYFYDAKDIKKYGYGWQELNMTCDEMIIKGIIE